MTIRARVAILVGTLVAVATAIGGFASYASARGELYEEIDDFLAVRCQELTYGDRREPPGGGGPGGGPPGDGVGPGGEFHEGPEQYQGRPVSDADAVTQIVASDGTVVFPDDGVPVLPIDADLLAAAPESGHDIRTVSYEGVRYRLAIAALPALGTDGAATDEATTDDAATLDDGGVVMVARELAETDAALDGVRGRIILAAVAVSLAGAGLGWLGARRMARPIERLAASAEHVARTEELDTPIDARGPGEVRRLASSLTTMLGALHRSRRQQQDLVLDAGHELRTPLTTLRTNAELLENPALSPEDRSNVIASMRTELSELTDLVNELVALGTDTRRTDPPQPGDLAEVVDAVVGRARVRYERSVTVTGQAVPIIGQLAMLERAVSNLVDNAVKFSPQGSPVEVVLVPGRVSVRDHGPGIDPEDRDRIFDRFYRSATSRTLPGSGLGLAIVAQVAQDHGGEPFADPAPGGGAIVGFTFAATSSGPRDS